MKTFEFHFLSADETMYDGPCVSLILPLTTGKYGIKANHIDMIAAVVTGALAYRVPGETELRHAAVSEGMVKIENNEVLLLVDSAERPEEIDINKAQRLADESREAMLQKKSILEYKSAEANLARAINRLKVKHDYQH